MKTTKEQFDEIVGRQPRPVFAVAVNLGLLLIVAGTLIPIFVVAGSSEVHLSTRLTPVFKYVYTAGAVLTLVGRIFSPYTGTDRRIKRLFRIESWSAVCFCVGAFFLFYEPYTTANWLAFTLAGAIIQVMSSVMIPRAFKKALKAADRNNSNDSTK